MAPPPSPTRTPSVLSQPVPERHGSQHTTFTVTAVPVPSTPPPRSSAPSPSLPAYSPPSLAVPLPEGDTDVTDYKPPLALPPSPPDLLSNTDAYDWDDGSNTGWPTGTRAWSPSSMEVMPSRPPSPKYGPPTFAESMGMAVDEPPPGPQYGSGVLQELFVHDVLRSSLPRGYTPAIDPGPHADDVPTLFTLSLRGLPVPSSSTPSPPTLDEITTLLPLPLPLAVPFLPRRWLPLLPLIPNLPPLVRAPDPPLPTFAPDTKICTDFQLGRQGPGVHHFHHVPSVVDPAFLPPSARSDSTPSLDLYFCCRCPTYVAAPPLPAKTREDAGTGVGVGLETVIPNDVWAQYVEQRMNEPPAGMTGPEAVLQAMEILLKILEALLWQHKTQAIKVRNPAFARKVGWSDTVAQMVTSLGWTIATESEWHNALRSASSSPIASPPPSSPTTSLTPQRSFAAAVAAAASPPPSSQSSTSASIPAPALSQGEDGLMIYPPRSASHPGTTARKNMLRAWVEIQAFVQVWRRRYPELKEEGEGTGYVVIADAREELGSVLGVESMFDFDTRRPITGQSQQAFNALGLGPHWTPNLVVAAYELQTGCHRARWMHYFSCLVFVVEAFPSASDDLGLLVAQERSKGRVTLPEISEAYAELGFGDEGDLLMDGDDVGDEHVWLAFESRVNDMTRMFGESAGSGIGPPPPPAPSQQSADVDVNMEEPSSSTLARPPLTASNLPKQSWLDKHRSHTRAEVKQALKQALETLASARQSNYLISRLRAGDADRVFGMDPESAYLALGVPRETEDEMVLAVWASRVADVPGQAERWGDAVRAIARERGSWRLERGLETGVIGQDGPATAVPMEFPRGLDQLGNTCYLNSLLQYFYTIRELRESIVDSSKIEDEVELISSGALESRRVGGRLVTKREIARSTQFVRLLAFLFVQLSVAETPSVTPELELAKLALVTSQDEEEDKQLQATTPVATTNGETATTSEATLVDEPMPMASSDPTPPPEQSTHNRGPLPFNLGQMPFPIAPSVLGKRDRNSSQPKTSRSVMDIDSLVEPSPTSTAAPAVIVSPSPIKSPRRAHTTPYFDRSSVDRDSDNDEPRRASTVPMDVDAERSSQPPPTTEETQEDVVMQTAEASQVEPEPEVEMETPVPPASQMQVVKKPPPLPPRSSTKKPEVQSESFMMFGRQHDVSECMDHCMFQIEAALKPDQGLSETSLVKRLFYGKLRQRVTGLNNPRGSTHEKDDLFAHLHVNVGDENFDLYDGLAGYFEDVVELEGQPAKMEVTLVDPPPLLQIQLQRVQFNRETLQAYKSNAYVKFGETLCMDRFLESADPEKRERSKQLNQQLRETRDRIKDLTQNKNGSFVDALDDTRKILNEQKELEIPEWDNDFSLALQAEREELTKEIQNLREHAAALKAELEDIWKNDREAEYELASVFMHRGNHSFGHYWFYSRWLPDKPDQWFKYNDSNVTLIPKQEVLGDGTPSTANPYLLVFARKGSNTIDTVKRLI